MAYLLTTKLHNYEEEVSSSRVSDEYPIAFLYYDYFFRHLPPRRQTWHQQQHLTWLARKLKMISYAGSLKQIKNGDARAGVQYGYVVANKRPGVSGFKKKSPR